MSREPRAVTGVRDCGRHTDEDRAWLDECAAELFAVYAGQPCFYGCANCGAVREAEWQDELVCACGWVMVALPGPPTSRADPLAGGSALKPSKRVQSGFGHGPP